jgi:hypothetical protein
MHEHDAFLYTTYHIACIQIQIHQYMHVIPTYIHVYITYMNVSNTQHKNEYTHKNENRKEHLYLSSHLWMFVWYGRVSIRNVCAFSSSLRAKTILHKLLWFSLRQPAYLIGGY